VALLLSLGPFLVILGKNTGLPLPYLLFYYLVPGFHVHEGASPGLRCWLHWLKCAGSPRFLEGE